MQIMYGVILELEIAATCSRNSQGVRPVFVGAGADRRRASADVEVRNREILHHDVTSVNEIYSNRPILLVGEFCAVRGGLNGAVRAAVNGDITIAYGDHRAGPVRGLNDRAVLEQDRDRRAA